jgi:uncharacterized coiled-coil protein SlyX
MATPRKPRASEEGGTDGPADAIEAAVVPDAAAAVPEPHKPVTEHPNPLESHDLPLPPEASPAAPDRSALAAAEARIAELADRVAAAERAVAARPDPAVNERKGNALPGIVGGVIAAAIGFAAAQIVPQGWPIGDVSDLRGTVATQGKTLQALADQVAAIPPAPEPAAPPDLSPLQTQIDTLADRLTAAEAAVAAVPVPPDPTARLAAHDSRIKALEALPPGTVIEGAATVDPAATAALEQQIAALKADMASQGDAARAAVAEVAAAAEAARAALSEAQAEAARLKDTTAATSQAAAASAALGRLAAALETGAPFQTAVADLAASGHAAPAALADHAATGLPTLASLQADFPDAARAALEMALKADMGDSTTERIATFLRTQVGVRSLEPREGNDPDAVLSRAEAALAAGDLDGALTEIAALPEAGQTAMADWVARAMLRRDAGTALAGLSAAVGG